MRYKLLVCAFVLLIATPVLGQEFSPIVVETGKPMPSIVRSGEPFKVTYRAKFFDTVVVYEEQMKPDNLALEKIEVIGLEVAKERISNDTLGFVNVWDFTYTFRIIHPEKIIYKIPSFNFIWAEKKAGVTVEETKDKEKSREMPTEEVGVGYVSSIVRPPILDIRDEINFISPIANGVVLRRWAYSVIGAAFLFSAVIIFRFSRKVRKSQETNKEEATAGTSEGDIFADVEPILSPKQARKKFLRELNKLLDEKEPTMDLEKRLRFLVRSFLLAELQGTIRDSMSENEIYSKLCSLDFDPNRHLPPNYFVMMRLSLMLKCYQEDIDLGICSQDIVEEITELREAVSGLKFYKRILSFMRHLVRGVR